MKTFKVKMMIKPFYIILCTSFFILSCTQKRPDLMPQGSGVNVISLSALDNKMFDLETQGVRAEGNTSSANRGIKIEKDYEATLRPYSIVNFTSKATLLPKEIEFRARPNTKGVYRIMYKVTDLYLKVMKVAKENDLPSFEMNYAEPLKNGFFAVPLLGYSVNHLKLEYAKDGDNVNTNSTVFIPLSEKGGVSGYVRVNKHKYERFDALNKNEVFLSDFFGFEKDEWYFSESIVKASGEDEALSQISSLSYDSDFSLATKVKFVTTSENEVKVLNVAKAKGYEDFKDLVHNSPVLILGANFVDYDLDQSGSEKSLREVEKKEKNWKKRKYVHLNLESVNTIKNSRVSGTLEKVTIAKDYFSFTVFVQAPQRKFGQQFDLMGNIESPTKIKYSFMRIKKKSTLDPKYAFSDDLRRFGLITRTKKKIRGSYKDTSEIDDDKNRLALRFNPKEIVKFYLSESTDKKYERYAQFIIDTWNKYLLENKINKGLKLENKRISAGDIRGNVFHFDEGNRTSPWIGVNISLSDPDTGEIFHTKVNVAVSTIRSYFIHYLRFFVLQEVGHSNFIINSVPNQVSYSKHFEQSLMQEKTYDLPLSELNMKHTVSGGYYFNSHFLQNSFLRFDTPNMYKSSDLVPFSFLNPQGSHNSQVSEESVFQKKYIESDLFESEHKTPFGLSQFKCNHMAHPSNMNEPEFLFNEIRKKCVGKPSPEGIPSIASYLESLKASKNLDLTMRLDYKVLENCANKILEREIIATGMHEMGHALGLGHNFKASFDKANFYKLEELSDPEFYSESSSLMDYPGPGDVPMVLPGKYDIATLKFLYNDQVQLKSGDYSKPVNKNLPLKYSVNIQDIKKYEYCDGISAEHNLDPMCNQFDRGTSALEVAKNMIKSYIFNFKTSRYTFDRSYGTSPYYVYLSSIKRLRKLKRIYTELRYLMVRKLGRNHAYLQAYRDDRDLYLKHMDLLKKDPAVSDKYKDYRAASDLIFKFLLEQMSFWPNQYCLIGDENKGDQQEVLDIVELDSIRKKLDLGGDYLVASCKQGMVKKAIQTIYKDKPLYEGFVPKVLGEEGHPFQSAWFSTEHKDVVNMPMSVIGSQLDRINSFVAITNRDYHNVSNYLEDFYPNFLDEPHYRKATIDKLLDRVLNGVKITSSPKYFFKYSDEKVLLREMYFIFKYGLLDPETRLHIQNERQGPYITRARQKSYYEYFDSSSANNYTFFSKDIVIFTPNSENTVASILIDEHSRLDFLDKEPTPMKDDYFYNAKILLKSIPTSAGLLESIDEVKKVVAESEQKNQNNQKTSEEQVDEKTGKKIADGKFNTAGFEELFNKYNPEKREGDKEYKDLVIEVDKKKTSFSHFVNFFNSLKNLIKISDKARQNHLRLIFKEELKKFSEFQEKYKTQAEKLNKLIEREKVMRQQSNEIDSEQKLLDNLIKLTEETKEGMKSAKTFKALFFMPLTFVLKDEFSDLMKGFHSDNYENKINNYFEKHKIRQQKYYNNPVEYMEKKELLLWMLLPFY